MMTDPPQTQPPASATIPALRIRDVQQRYGDQPILEGIDLTLKSGEYLALIGVNGAGKTTLIKGLLNFILLEAGRIEIYGQSHLEDAARRRLLFLPERFTPPAYFSGLGFMQHMAQLYGAPLSRERAEEIALALDLDPEALPRPVGSYSKGMTQKLGLAAMLLAKRPLLLLDEPMSGLDPKSRVLLKRYLLDLKAQGQSLFFSTHLLADVEALCDRMAILHRGKIRYFGTPSDCLTHYETTDLEQAFIRCIESV